MFIASEKCRELVIRLSFLLDFSPLLREDARGFFVFVIYFLHLHAISCLCCAKCVVNVCDMRAHAAISLACSVGEDSRSNTVVLLWT